jgi:hypothetical protein
MWRVLSFWSSGDPIYGWLILTRYNAVKKGYRVEKNSGFGFIPFIDFVFNALGKRLYEKA